MTKLWPSQQEDAKNEIVVNLTVDQAWALLDWTEGELDAPECDPDDEGLCGVCDARAKLQEALRDLEGAEG